MKSSIIISQDNAPMQLADFINIPQDQSYKSANLFWYDVQKIDESGIKLVEKESGERLALLKAAVLEAKHREKPETPWGSYLEFGVGSGSTLNFIAAIADNAFVYGFESGNGIGDDSDIQSRPLAYTKKIDKSNTITNGRFNDEYGDDSSRIEKEGLIQLLLKPRTSDADTPFIPFTPLCNVLLYLGAIENTLPAYIKEELSNRHRTNHISFIFIDTNDSLPTNAILCMLVDFVKSEKTIILTNHELEPDTVYTQILLSDDIVPVIPLTQDTVDLKFDNFIQRPFETSAKSNDNVSPIPPGRNVLHFKSTDRGKQFNENPTMAPLREQLKTKASPLMSDSEILQFGVDTARRNFAIDKDKTKFYLEFGFCTGRTINFIASLLERDEKLFGFDSGTGLPEKWRYRFPKGMFRYTKRIEKNATTGAIKLDRIPFPEQEQVMLDDNIFIPFIPHERVNLVMGLIENTVQEFVEQQLKPLGGNACVAFIYIDTDLQKTAKSILENLKKYIQLDKTVVVFDEAFNFDGAAAKGAAVSYDEWKKHEFKAMNDFRGDTGWYPIAYNQNGQQLAVIFKD